MAIKLCVSGDAHFTEPTTTERRFRPQHQETKTNRQEENSSILLVGVNNGVELRGSACVA
jgi:hypothetical protein